MRPVLLVACIALACSVEPVSSILPKRLLIIEGIQEQSMCAFKAFDEYLKDVATASSRALVVPDRYFFANLTATALPWQRCLRARSPRDVDPLSVGRVVLRKHVEWGVSQCASHKYVKLMRCRLSGNKGGCDGLPAGLSPCRDGNVGVDRCLVLNGLVHLKGLLAAVPEFEAPAVDCVTITSLARGVLVSPTEGPPCSAARWNPLMWSNDWVSRADNWLALRGLRRPETAGVTGGENGTNAQSSYIAVQFRTEKWPSAVASSVACWGSIAQALKAAATDQKVSTVFIATDALGSTSTTYAMKGGQKSLARKAFRAEVIDRLTSDGLKVVMWDPSAPDGVANTNAEAKTKGGGNLRALLSEAERMHAVMVHAAMDLLICSRAKLFVHMYGTFGRGADALAGCAGARAGSCYGNWIVHTRDFRARPTAMLSTFAPQEKAAAAGSEEEGAS